MREKVHVLSRSNDTFTIWYAGLTVVISIDAIIFSSVSSSEALVYTDAIIDALLGVSQ